MVYLRLTNLFQGITRRCSTNNWITKTAMASKLVLYGDEGSPPVQFTMIAASILNVKLDFHQIDVFKMENKSDFYTKINPLQKIPALQVGDDVICDSHAIVLYLCHISGSNSMYPEDPITRAKINQMMFFNLGTLFPIDSCLFTEYFCGKRPADKVKIDQWYSAMDYLECRLTNSLWLVNDKVSLGDFCCATTVGSLQQLVPLLDRHKKIGAWLDRLKEFPCFEIHTRGLKRLKGFVEQHK